MRGDSIFGTITEEQQARIDADNALVERLRARANVVWLRPEDKGAEGAVNCARCKYLNGFSADDQAGWCAAVKRKMSTWHPVRCELFTGAA